MIYGILYFFFRRPFRLRENPGTPPMTSASATDSSTVGCAAPLYIHQVSLSLSPHALCLLYVATYHRTASGTAEGRLFIVATSHRLHSCRPSPHYAGSVPITTLRLRPPAPHESDIDVPPMSHSPFSPTAK